MPKTARELALEELLSRLTETIKAWEVFDAFERPLEAPHSLANKRETMPDYTELLAACKELADLPRKPDYADLWKAAATVAERYSDLETALESTHSPTNSQAGEAKHANTTSDTADYSISSIERFASLHDNDEEWVTLHLLKNGHVRWEA